MQQMPKFPCLPGFNFDHNIGRSKFNRVQLFDKISDDVYYLADKQKLAPHSRYPAIYAWGEQPTKPMWLALDGQRLKFYAYFQESVHNRREPYRIRLVDISFFLEDGTIKVSEPAIENSGLEQGVLVKRQRIPLPDPVKYRYYDILDLNVGKEPKIFGRVYKIIDCDKFTRHFLNRMGIPVPEPLDAPADPLYQKQKIGQPIKNYQRKVDNLKNFLLYDRKVLRFYGYWDDSGSYFGCIHDLEILYFLVDGTMQIIDILPSEFGSAKKEIMLKKVKIPKFFTDLEPIGSGDTLTLLNVLGDNVARSYYVTDNSYSPKPGDYYKECDLAIGAQINVFGRHIVITDLDNFTKEYYRKKYGMDDFTPLDRPDRPDKDHKKQSRYVPPYNGFGSYEDSLGNCLRMVPTRPKVDTDKFFKYENQINDNRILRFGMRMISDVPANNDRRFVLNFYLFDKTIAIVEVASEKSGHTKSLFQKRMRIEKPGQDIFVSEKPKCFDADDLYVGAKLNLNEFKFEIETADEYTFNYMEKHCKEFPKSDVKAIMCKIKQHLRPVYREFIDEYSPMKIDYQPNVLRLACLREAMYKYVEDRITEHEIVTVARHYSICEQKDLYPREYVRALVHMELIRSCWNELDRLEEDINAWDRNKTGYLSHEQLYTILRAVRIPLTVELINLMLDRLLKNAEGKIDLNDLLGFLDVKVKPTPPVEPINLKALYWTNEERPKDCHEINWCAFLQDLGLEQELKETTSQSNEE